MKCELIDTFKFKKKYCRTLLPERLMFQHFGLTPKQAFKAAIEYFAGVGYIFFGNAQRDSASRLKRLKGRLGKQVVRAFMSPGVQSVVMGSDRKIGSYEAEDVSLEKYVSMIHDCGEDFYASIVEPKGGNYELAGKFGGTLAALTTLDDMVSHRDYDLAKQRYNPLRTESDIERAKEMLEEYQAVARQIMEGVLNNDTLAEQTAFEQAKMSLRHLKSPADLMPLAMTAPLYMGCACNDCAQTEVCDSTTITIPRVTCGGLAIAVIVGLICYAVCKD